MSIVFGILFALVAFLIIALILLQEGKGGGITGMGGGGMDGVVGVKNPLRRLTAIFSVVFILLVVGINYSIMQEENPNVDQGLTKDEAAPTTTPLTAPGETGTTQDASGLVPLRLEPEKKPAEKTGAKTEKTTPATSVKTETEKPSKPSSAIESKPVPDAAVKETGTKTEKTTPATPAKIETEKQPKPSAAPESKPVPDAATKLKTQ